MDSEAQILYVVFVLSWASLVVQRVKNMAAMLETWIRSLGQEDPSKQGMATHSSIEEEEAGVLQSVGSQRVGHDRATNTFTFFCIGSSH